MKRKLLWAVGFVGIVALVVGGVLYSRSPSTAATLPARLTSVIMPVYLWIHAATRHVTTTQIMEGAAIAWFVFVLALVLLARSGRTGAPTSPIQVEVPDEATVTRASAPPPAYMQDAAAYATPPLMPLDDADRELSPDFADFTSNNLDDPYEYAISSPAATQIAPDVLTKRLIGPEQPSSRVSEEQKRPNQRKQGHMLALTGIAQTDGQLVPYGLFLVAEDVGSAPGDGAASRRGIEIITEEIAPSLASGAVLKSAPLATLLKMAVMRADLDLREQGMRTATVLETAITGVMVVGDVVHVVNIGDCRTYLFRPSSGLLQITTAHSVISCLVDSGLLQPDAVYQHAQRDQVYRCLGGSHAATVIDVFELQVHPDDLVLLCSPGLWHALRRPQIESVLRTAPHPCSAATQLLQAGAKYTGDDAFTGLVVRPLGEWLPTFGIPIPTNQARPS